MKIPVHCTSCSRYSLDYLETPPAPGTVLENGVWVLDVPDLEALRTFVRAMDDEGSCILSADDRCPDGLRLEIYDDYRE